MEQHSLLNEIVMADNINLFMKCLDKFWLLHDSFISTFYRAQPLETGSVK